MDQIQDKIRGSLVAGAAGDALGYPVEFLREYSLFRTYGEGGIRSYTPAPQRSVAVVSDDTQMTLFTANALLFGMHRQKERGISGDPRHYALFAYLGWLQTQQAPYSPKTRIPDDWPGWASYLLQDVPELYVRRAPGTTCLNALTRRKEQVNQGVQISDYIADKLNDSKGCGGVMRVAPLGLAIHSWDMARLDMEGAQLAAITHSHPLGYIPAAVLTHILNRLVYTENPDLKAITLEARDFMAQIFPGEKHVETMANILDTVIALSENEDSDLDNIHKLGEGWVAEEALAIALYCSLKYKDDFSQALIVSVNHNGDSDSTGAITGNILGALLGYAAIEQKWTKSLEFHDLILQIADNLYTAFR